MRVAAPDDGLTHADLIPLQIAFAKLAVQQTLYGDFMHHRLNASNEKKGQKGVRNRLLRSERDFGMLETWKDQSDQLRAVGFIMC
jgi:hypothetical protein